MNMRRENDNFWVVAVGVLAAVLVLSACQIDNSALSSRKAAPVIIAPDAPKRPMPTNAVPREAVQRGTKDVVGDLIVKVETQQAGNQKNDDEIPHQTASIEPMEEAGLIRKQIQPSLPMPEFNSQTDDASSALAQQALNAALDLLRSKPKSVIQKTRPVKELSPAARDDGIVRVGLMLPLSGDYAELGLDIAGGIEIALFQTGEHDIELVYLDTKGGPRAYQAALDAKNKAVDIVIGPLFTASIEGSAEIFTQFGIPVLSMSNNQAAAQTGRWVLNYLPEQQMDNLLGYLVQENKMRIAILGSEDKFGVRMMSHATARLAELGISPAAVTILTPAVLADEPVLKETIKGFSLYISPKEETAELQPAPYDAVILAGNAEFVLRTAPVLAYYDLGPSRVTYVGTDLWTRAELLREPSLQGSIIARAEIPDAAAFESSWTETFQKGSTALSRLGFDSMALITVTKRAHESKIARTGQNPVDWKGSLIQEQGFAGFSGTFRLLPDGRNLRSYDLHLLRDGKLFKM